MNRAILRVATLILFASFILHIKAQDSGGHFYFAGPISQFLAPWARIASVTTGLRNGKADGAVSQAGGDDLYTKLFDIDISGNYWIASGLERDRSVYLVDASGKQSRRVAKGPDWHLGGALVPQAA